MNEWTIKNESIPKGLKKMNIKELKAKSTFMYETELSNASFNDYK